MSITKTIPKSSRFIQVDTDFTATFNSPVLGKYSFNKTENINKLALEPINKTSIYLIDRYSFSATIPDGVFLSAIDEIPTAQILKRINGLPVYQKPIPCINYVDNSESLAYFNSSESSQDQKNNDALLISFRGVLKQIPELVGITEIKTHLSFSVYEIIDESWIRLFFERTNFQSQNKVII